MITWIDVINHVRQRHELLEETDAWLRFRPDTGEAAASRSPCTTCRTWTACRGVETSSAVGRADNIDQRRLIDLAGTSDSAVR